MRPILVTGADGFIGRAVVALLKGRGHDVLALERRAGDILDDGTLSAAFSRRPAAVIQLVGRHIPVQAAAKCLGFARRWGVRRYIHMSSLGAAADSRCRYHRRKWAAERLVRASGLAWTIFRPSVVYGESCDFIRSMELLAGMAGLTPMLSSGRCRVQPIHVEDAARAVCDSLFDPSSEGRTFDLAGPEVLTLDDVLDRIENARGAAKLRVHLPLWLGWPVIALQRIPPFSRAFRRFYAGITPERWLNRDHLELLREDNVASTSVPASGLRIFDSWLRSRSVQPAR
jgi:NADH dehydrogenase